ncbi:MAG: hypothetical protein ACREFH_18595, partial [Stellaceae bacterium]
MPGQRGRQRTRITFRDGGERRFWAAFAVDEAERPIRNRMTAGEPLVGPGKDKSPGDPRRERGTDLPGKNIALLIFT